MIHTEIKRLANLIYWGGIAVGVITFIGAFLERHTWLYVSSALGIIGSAYVWSIVLRSFAQQGEDLEGIHGLLARQQERQRNEERERQQRERSATPPRTPPPSPREPAPLDEVDANDESATMKPVEGEEVSLIRPPLSMNKGMCGSCGHTLFIARIGDTCPKCGATFTREERA